MKVLLVNKYFYRRGGAEVVFFNTADLLRAAGHEVVEFAMHHPSNEPSPYAEYFVDYIDYPTLEGHPAKLLGHAARTIYSREAFRKLSRLLERERPDIAHLHNIYFHLTPSILYALREARVPVVQTLHDYHLVCANHILYNHRTGAPCEDCLRFGRHSVILTGCMRVGRLRSLVGYLEGGLYRLLRTHNLLVHRYIAPSEFLRSKVSPNPVPRDRIAVLPNPVEDFGAEDFGAAGEPDDAAGESGEVSGKRSDVSGGPDRARTFFFAGRLAHEKGIDLILEVARRVPESRWRIAGEGPMEPGLRKATPKGDLPNVELTGRLGGPALREEYRRAAAVVLPSRCYENCPLAVLEAMSAGRPTIGSRLGGIAELVRENETGLLFEMGSAGDLERAVRQAMQWPGDMSRMGRSGRALFEQRYAPAIHLKGLLAVYDEAFAQRSA
jgi:glycosyltransferase involved in cell wall biosynthesis